MKRKPSKLKIALGIFGIIILAAVLIWGAVFSINYFSNSPSVSRICTPGDKRCIDDYSSTCNSQGTQWINGEYCDYGCGSFGDCKDAPFCKPLSCLSGYKGCGLWPDSCGGSIECGSCGSGDVCSNGICKPSCIKDTCSSLSKTCGTFSDGCGGTISCGTCYSGFTCINGKCNQDIVSGLPKFSDSYETARKAAGISDDYLKETWYYDYKSSTIKNIVIVTSLNGNKDPKFAAKNVAYTVFQSVDYDTKYQTGPYCYNNRASQIWNNKKGVCSTMSRVNVAVLRGLGLAAREVTGCVHLDVTCQTMTVFKPEIKMSKEVKEGNRYITGGGAHTWVEVWLPNSGWTILESTAGVIYPVSCVDYWAMAKEPNFNDNADECSMSEVNYLKCLAW